LRSGGDGKRNEATVKRRRREGGGGVDPRGGRGVERSEEGGRRKR